MKQIFFYLNILLCLACSTQVERVETTVAHTMSCIMRSDSLPRQTMDNAFLSFFLFEESRLKMFTQGIIPDDKGKFNLSIIGNTKDEICVVWSESAPVTGLATQGQLNSCVTGMVKGVVQPFYTGKLQIENIAFTQNVMLKSGVACIDVVLDDSSNILLDSCIIEGMANKSYVMPGNNDMPVDVQYVTDTMKLNTSRSVREMVYLYESFSTPIVVTLFVKWGGNQNIVNVTLPNKIERGKRYKIKLNGNCAALISRVVVADWAG
ncbi:MAG: hypothetical protein ACRDDZ_03990 [Marinifilaceae bacterium]